MNKISSPYRDIRQKFFGELFAKGLKYRDYVLSGSAEQIKRWESFEKLIEASAAQQQVLGTFIRKMHVVVLSGTWCGDCARQGPMLHVIEKAAPTIECRFFDNKSHPELQEELRINGAERVPVVVLLSEDFFEVLRFGDRHLSVYRRKALLELGPACDSGLTAPSSSELATEFQEWLDCFERAQLLLRLAPALRRRHAD